MKKTLFALLICVISLPGFGQKVGQYTARMAAQHFWFMQKSVSVTPHLSTALTSGQDTLLYVFNLNTQGFIVVPNHYSLSPVLAYSDEGVFKPNHIAPACQAWLDNYANQVAYNLSSKSTDYNDEWIGLLPLSELSQPLNAKAVAPLLTTRWNQDSYYNLYCPAHTSGPGGHCYAGCVATTMAQIMKYHNYPPQGLGAHSYYHPNYGNLSANFADSTYDFSNMGNVATNANKKYIALLIYHAGVSVDMNYTPTGSGAQSANVVDAMKNHFHYRSTISLVKRSSVTQQEWMTIMKDNLDMSRPIYHSGSGSGGGHAWVCDGYDAQNRFHMNWGWGGSANGYFKVDTLNSGNGDFSSGQQIIVNIVPYFGDYCIEGRVFTDSTRTISDGSGYSYYWNNTQCDWLISHPNTEKVMLQFSEFDTEANNDVLNIYDGTSTSAPLLGSFSGTNNPGTIIANSGNMYLTFSSNTTTQGLGWSAKYWCLKQGAGINEMENQMLQVYPNPANDIIYVMGSSPQQWLSDVRIYDLAGKEMLAADIQLGITSAQPVDVSRLSKGLYIIKVSNNTHTLYSKFVKE